MLAVTKNDESTCCELDGALESLENDSYWAGSDVSLTALECAYDLVLEYNRNCK